ncbi:zinc finger protein 622 [Cephus cinctus]|uniref:Zinc finger protein 622 n=1 Tax=Cephus cinctus TaxID=211228 RepID=A0AAJ7BJH1_CEPCN|nr:zinc finger protein 622 [Cephus cinctus]XP_015587177.1 zinc finger protein 622 [Cephus cinctus]XP_024937339.1 zinc finger protein 622 [Cephus cinctus]
MTSQYTCITCRVAFRDLEIQRQHYKSDWHRYNLKRKVAELPPVTSEEFQRRVIAQRGKHDQMKQEQSISCKACRKNFNTKNQYENHILSKKHKEKVQKIENSSVETTENVMPDDSEKSNTKSNEIRAQSKDNKSTTDDMEIDSDVESIDSDEWLEDTENPVGNNDCLFCNHHSRSYVRNLKHMTLAHTFFIPDPEYCIDIKGLLVYLGEKVFAGYMCLWCNDSGRAFQSADAARAHMIDKGHCKMLHEGEALAEYAEFYDYSSSYPDAEQGDPDAEVEIPELEDSDYQLVLPSGSVIGHRSLMRYYKQSLNPNRAVAIPKSEKLRRVLSHYRALGWTETQHELASRKARDIKYMQKIQSKYSTQLQFKANKFQRHFRPQVNF